MAEEEKRDGGIYTLSTIIVIGVLVVCIVAAIRSSTREGRIIPFITAGIISAGVATTGFAYSLKNSGVLPARKKETLPAGIGAFEVNQLIEKRSEDFGFENEELSEMWIERKMRKIPFTKEYVEDISTSDILPVYIGVLVMSLLFFIAPFWFPDTIPGSWHLFILLFLIMVNLVYSELSKRSKANMKTILTSSGNKDMATIRKDLLKELKYNNGGDGGGGTAGALLGGGVLGASRKAEPGVVPS